VLLNSGADIRKTLKSGQTALAHAAEHGYNDIVELLKRTMSRSKDVKSQSVLESGSRKSVLTLS
jgi:ankyrin repeat protein